MAKVLIISLDGATWDLIKPWVEEAKLPHIKRMMEDGIWGGLESTLPPVTGPAWVSFATGKNPGKHGCYDFVLPKGSLSELKPITSKDIKGKTFYEILDGIGRKCIIVNLPGSYPPRIKEIVITSLLTQGDNFIFPPHLISEIPELADYRIIPNKRLQFYGKTTAYIEDVARLEETRFECARKLFTEKNWDFFFLLVSGTDTLQHLMFDKLISGDLDEDSPAFKFYQRIDQYIGWFTANAPDDTNTFVMSDHGFKAYEKTFYVNEWLRREGYLLTEIRTKMPVARQRGDKQVMEFLSQKRAVKVPCFVSNSLRSVPYLEPLYRKLARWLPVRLDLDIVQPRISETTALSTFSVTNVGGIYINDSERFTDGKVMAKDYENLRNELIAKLDALINSNNGERIINQIWKKEELYFGTLAPDIIFVSHEYLMNTSFRGKVFTNEIGNGHALNGIFIAYGSNIKKHTQVDGAKIYDIAPTILHMFGLPVPDDMDGRVLKKIFREGSEPAQREVKYQKVDVERERVKEKIRKLKDGGKI